VEEEEEEEEEGDSGGKEGKVKLASRNNVQ